MSEKYPGSILNDEILDAINLDGEHYPELVVRQEAEPFDPNKWTEEIDAVRKIAHRILNQE